MANTCLNCGCTIIENFCSNCGQKKFKRIDKKYVTEELQYLLVHTNKGFLYSIKKIIKNPGKTAREFIDGNRVNHYKPMLLTFVLSGISAFISFKVIGFQKLLKEFYAAEEISSPFMDDLMSIYSGYNSLIMLAFIPIFALVTWISFIKWKHNYYEHIVMNAYILSFQTLASIIVFSPFLYFFRENSAIVNVIVSAITLIILPTFVWFFRGFYADKPFKQILLRTLAVIGLVMVAFFLTMILTALGGVIYALIKGPEALEYIRPKGT